MIPPLSERLGRTSSLGSPLSTHIACTVPPWVSFASTSSWSLCVLVSWQPLNFCSLCPLLSYFRPLDEVWWLIFRIWDRQQFLLSYLFYPFISIFSVLVVGSTWPSDIGQICWLPRCFIVCLGNMVCLVLTPCCLFHRYIYRCTAWKGYYTDYPHWPSLELIAYPPLPWMICVVFDNTPEKPIVELCRVTFLWKESLLPPPPMRPTHFNVWTVLYILAKIWWTFYPHFKLPVPPPSFKI